MMYPVLFSMKSHFNWMNAIETSCQYSIPYLSFRLAFLRNVSDIFFSTSAGTKACELLVAIARLESVPTHVRVVAAFGRGGEACLVSGSWLSTLGKPTRTWAPDFQSDRVIYSDPYGSILVE